MKKSGIKTIKVDDEEIVVMTGDIDYDNMLSTIKALMKQKGVTSVQLAKRETGYSYRTLCEFMSENRHMHLDAMIAIVNSLGVSLESLCRMCRNEMDSRKG